MRPPRTALVAWPRPRSWPPPSSPVRGGAQADRRRPAPERGPLPTRVGAAAPAAHRLGPCPVHAHCPARLAAHHAGAARYGRLAARAAARADGLRVGRTAAPAPTGTSGGQRHAGPEDGRRPKAAARRQADATPMIAGTRAAADLVDDESSPELYRRASRSSPPTRASPRSPGRSR